MSGRTGKGSRPGQAWAGSESARRLAAAVLEVLSGECSPASASRAVGISLPRYYQVEHRALGGLIAALEPIPRGKRPSPQSQLAALERDKRRLEREVGRLQALVRAAHRSMGLSALSASSAKAEAGRRRRSRPKVRARRAIRLLTRPTPSDVPAPPEG